MVNGGYQAAFWNLSWRVSLSSELYEKRLSPSLNKSSKSSLGRLMITTMSISDVFSEVMGSLNLKNWMLTITTRYKRIDNMVNAKQASDIKQDEMMRDGLDLVN